LPLRSIRGDPAGRQATALADRATALVVAEGFRRAS
jgi:hypothetical protein